MARAVGITQFLNHCINIGGVLKHLPSDFIVNEVDSDRNVVKLTNQVFIHEEPVKNDSELSENAKESLRKAIGDDLCDKIIRLTEQILGGANESIIEIPCPEEKQNRTIIHQSIREYAGMLTSSTEIEKNTIKIYSSKLAHSFNKRQKLGLDSRGAKKLESKFIKFVMQKENIDTMKALKILASASGIKDKSFGIAGNKDKRAITTQNITAFSNYLEKLKHAKLPQNIKIGCFQYCDQELKIGDLYGNQFEIVIRNFKDINKEILAHSINRLEADGFINYFGLQRFGNSANNSTHSIGLAILTKNYSHAVDLILGPRPVKNPQEQQAREN